MKLFKIPPKKRYLIVLLLCVLLGMIGYLVLYRLEPAPPESSEQEAVEESEETKETERIPAAVWGVYWDGNIANVLSQQYADSDYILFGAYFDSRDQVFIPESLETLRDTTQGCVQGRTYLSFVNDIQYEDGTTSQKNPELLKRLLQSDNTMKAVIDSMLEITAEWNCDGIEIDFEKIEAAGVWEEYIHFLELLIDSASSCGLDVRVVLGVNAPADEYEFPAGAEYVIMCYNLYGYHSGPGPKADMEFLKGGAERFCNLESVHFALANGGFLWDEKDKVQKSLTGKAAEELLQESGAVPQRDESSYALYFTFEDENGTNTVWYADDITLAKWAQIIETVMGNDAKIDSWRVESNGKDM